MATHPDWLTPAMRALADPVRRRVVWELRNHEECVSVLAGQVGITTALASHHLRTLVQAGLVSERTDGHWHCYHLRPDALEHLLADLTGLLDPDLPPTARPGASTWRPPVAERSAIRIMPGSGPDV